MTAAKPTCRTEVTCLSLSRRRLIYEFHEQETSRLKEVDDQTNKSLHDLDDTGNDFVLIDKLPAILVDRL
jgi:hypothetical protein